MKKLSVSYEIEHTFSQDVTDHHFLIKCIPMENGFQHCERISMGTDPETSLMEVEDGFGNRGYSGVIEEAHKHFDVSIRAEVTTGGTLKEEPLLSVYRFQSEMTRPGGCLRDFFGKIEAGFPSEFPEVEKAALIMHKLYEGFEYRSGVTNVKTTAEEALVLGTGVCQDYAHIMISLLRMAHIPARYVAGLMVGEGATHAWVEAWAEGRWVGFDPTHNVYTGENYIKLTHGRDFVDGSVDKGCFTGFALQGQSVFVKVEEIDQGKC